MPVYVEKSGYDDLEKELEDMMKEMDDESITNTLKTGAEEFRDDLLKLPSPRSRINAAGHTHLLDTFATKQEGTGWLVGWGRYYGPIIEHGWSGAGKSHKSKHSAIPHFHPTFARNKEKYYNDMISKIFGGDK